jgi:hypothetical protein
MNNLQKWWLDKFDDFLGSKNARLTIERVYETSTASKEYVVETKNMYFRSLSFNNYSDIKKLEGALGVHTNIPSCNRSHLKIGDELFSNFDLGFESRLTELLNDFNDKFFKDLVSQSRVWRLSAKGYNKYFFIDENQNTFFINHRDFTEEFTIKVFINNSIQSIVERIAINRVVDVGLRDLNFTHMFKEFPNETPYIALTPVALDTTPLDVLGLDLNKVNNENILKVFVGRNNKYYGSFAITDDLKTHFYTCEVSGYILTALGGFFNERRFGLGKAISLHIEKNAYTYCDMCGVRHEKSDVNNGICSYCSKQITRYNLNPTLLKNYKYDVHDHDYRQSLEFLTTPKDTEDKKLFLGVELEIDSNFISDDNDGNPCGCGDENCDDCNNYENAEGTDHRQNANTILHSISNKAHNNVIGKWDGSLESGFEIVSQPATLNAHTDLIDWKNGFKTIIDIGYGSHDFGTCGLHVHINRDFFGDNKTTQNYNGAKIVYLLEKYWDKFVVFTRRKTSHLERWAKRGNAKYDYDKNDTKTSTMLTNAFQKNYYEGREKYIALNTLHNATFELRIFRGTLNYTTFIATLQFVDNLARLVKKTPLSRLTDLAFEDIINFKKYDELSTYWGVRNGGNTTTDGGN